MADLDALVNQTFSVDSQYFGANVLSGTYTQQIPLSFAYTLTSETVQALDDAGAGGVRNISEQLHILAVNDSTNTITFDFSTGGTTTGQLTDNVLGYDPSTDSLLLDSALNAGQVAQTIALGDVSDLNSTTSILSAARISPETTITYPALTSSTVVGLGSSSGSGTSGGTTSEPVYRFFDTTYGTHLFTQSLSEADTILATRPDLTEETNTFGAVSQTDPSAEAVYRFFETTNGTHFFTSSYNEFLGLTTPGTSTYRSDFTYESSSTFYEDSTQQSGDVAVYRFFDDTTGTQFLTGSQSEYQGLITPGTSTYRADFANEGIAFYAPAGTFHT